MRDLVEKIAALIIIFLKSNSPQLCTVGLFELAHPVFRRLGISWFDSLDEFQFHHLNQLTTAVLVVGIVWVAVFAYRFLCRAALRAQDMVHQQAAAAENPSHCHPPTETPRQQMLHDASLHIMSIVILIALFLFLAGAKSLTVSSLRTALLPDPPPSESKPAVASPGPEAAPNPAPKTRYASNVPDTSWSAVPYTVLSSHNAVEPSEPEIVAPFSKGETFLAQPVLAHPPISTPRQTKPKVHPAASHPPRMKKEARVTRPLGLHAPESVEALIIVDERGKFVGKTLKTPVDQVFDRLIDEAARQSEYESGTCDGLPCQGVFSHTFYLTDAEDGPPVLLEDAAWSPPYGFTIEKKFSVTLTAQVGIDGKIEVLYVKTSDPELAASLKAAAEHCRYRPAHCGGRPCVANVSITFTALPQMTAAM